MWYRLSKDKKRDFKYQPILKNLKNKKTRGFSIEDPLDDTDDNTPTLDQPLPLEVEPELTPELTPETVETPELTPPLAIPSEEPAPILIDSEEQPIQSDNLLKPNPAMPVAPHDNCNCANNIEKFPSGKMIWKITDSMCDICKKAAQDFNQKQTMLFPDPQINI